MAKVIVVDDDPLVCDILCEYVLRLKHIVQKAHTLLEGRTMIQEGHYDLVFLDVRLPFFSALCCPCR